MIVIYCIHETILILRRFKRNFSYHKDQYSTKVVSKFKEVLQGRIQKFSSRERGVGQSPQGNRTFFLVKVVCL